MNTKVIGMDGNIDEITPIGICGSGVLSIVSESIKSGIIDKKRR